MLVRLYIPPTLYSTRTTALGALLHRCTFHSRSGYIYRSISLYIYPLNIYISICISICISRGTAGLNMGQGPRVKTHMSFLQILNSIPVTSSEESITNYLIEASWENWYFWFCQKSHFFLQSKIVLVSHSQFEWKMAPSRYFFNFKGGWGPTNIFLYTP